MDISNKTSNIQITKYISSNLIGTISGNMLSYGLGLMLLSETGNAISFGLDLIITPLVSLFGLVPIGNIVDHYRHKKILIFSILIRIILLFALLLTINLFSGIYKLIPIIPFLIATSFFTNMSSTTYSASVNELVNKDKIQALSSLSGSANSLASIVSILLGFSFYSWLGFNLFLVIGIFSCIISLFIILSMKFYYNDKSAEHSTSKMKGQINNFIEGIKYVSGKKLIIDLIIIGVFLNFLFSSTNIGLPFLIKTKLNEPNYFIAYEEVGNGVGFLVGSFLFTFLPNNKYLRLKIMSPLFLIGFYIFLLGIIFEFITNGSSAIVYICIITFLIGLSLSMIEITSQVKIQTTIPTEYLGRVVSILITANSMILPIGTIIFTFLFNIMPNKGILFIIVGIIALAYGITILPRIIANSKD